MRQPWYQLTDELIEEAPELAIRLGISEAEAGWGIVRMIQGFLKRCPDGVPPSASARIRAETGPVAARICAELARFRGDSEAWVACCEQLPVPILEVSGAHREVIRLRGADRYDPLWGKSHPEEWAEWKRKHSKPNGKPTGPKPGRNRAGTGPEPSQTRPGTVADSARERAKTGPQDVDRDQDRDLEPPPPSPSAPPPCPPALSLVPGVVVGVATWESPPSALWARLRDEHHHPAVVVAPAHWDALAGLIDAKDAKDVRKALRRLGKVVTPQTADMLADVVIGRTELEWAECFANFFDLRQSQGSNFEATNWALEMLLAPGVLKNKMPPRTKVVELAPEPTTQEGKIWAQVLRELREAGKVEIAKGLAAFRPLGVGHGVLRLGAPDPYRMDWARECLALLESVAGLRVELEVIGAAANE